jgi:stearoyl-CoA desaturase (delta-9 desaturase)
MTSTTIPSATREKDWVNILFLTFTPIIGVVGTLWYTLVVGFAWWMPVLLVSMYLAVGISICAGYHRLFSHKSYEASPLIQTFYAFFGAMAAQNSILWWSSSHRRHHKHVDQDWDPYNIKRGFWWAHMFWIFYRNPDSQDFENSPDLVKNRVVRWQHRWHKVILILGGFGIPTLIGAMFGHPVGGLLWGGFLRVVVIHHTTFFVNSLAHKVGEQSYSSDVSARDNWAVALVTLGEGYHSFHHRFPADFRNGIRWYQWDPAKWFIAGLKAVGLASDLRATPAPMIEQARLQAVIRDIDTRIDRASAPVGEEIRLRITRARESLDHAFALWRQQAQERARGISGAWRETRRNARKRVKQARREWRAAIRLLAQENLI